MQDEIIKPRGIVPFPYTKGYEVGRGDRCDLVTVIQMMLCELKVYYDCFGDGSACGVYDGATEEAVRAYQRASRSDETGRVDVLTWNRLAEEYNVAVCENQ